MMKKSLLDIPDGDPDAGEQFVMALARYVSDKFYRTCFSEYGKAAACECSHCNRENCPHREAYCRILKEDGGMEVCPILSEKQ